MAHAVVDVPGVVVVAVVANVASMTTVCCPCGES